MKQPSTKERMLDLHDLVLTALEARLSEGQADLKSIEVAIKFLKDNNVFVDLSSDKDAAREELKAKMARIPRLTQDDLKLG